MTLPGLAFLLGAACTLAGLLFNQPFSLVAGVIVQLVAIHEGSGS